MTISSRFKLFILILVVSGTSASAQSLMQLMRSQRDSAIEGKWEINSGSNAPELNFYNNDYCDFYLVRRSSGKSYELHPGRNTVKTRSSRNRHVREKMSQYLTTSQDLPYLPKEEIKKRTDKYYAPPKTAGSYRRYPGKFPKKLNESFPYALPVKHGKETSWRTDSLENYLTLNFSVPTGDTVYATRGGVVCKAGDGRQVLVYHSDCTFAAYLMLERKFVSPGDEIHTGEPIGVASSQGVSISFYYLNKTQFRRGEKVADYPYAHFVPVFRTDEGDVKPEEGKMYRAVTDDALITQEMSKREKREYLKEKKVVLHPAVHP